jgi:hypothetical protein
MRTERHRRLDVGPLEWPANERPEGLGNRRAIHFLAGRHDPEQPVRIDKAELGRQLEHRPRLRVYESPFERIAKFSKKLRCRHCRRCRKANQN